MIQFGVKFMDEKRIAAAIKANSIFAGCDDRLLLEAAESGWICDAVFEAGDLVCGGKGFESSLGIVASGKLKVARRDGDRQISLNTIGTGGCFGASSMFGSNDMQTIVTAASRTKVVFINEDGMKYLLRADCELGLSYISFLTGRIRFLNSKIRSFTGGSSSSRLSSMLIESADENGVCRISGCAELARRLDVSRASIYRSLGALEEKGAIKRDGRTITVTDRELLLG